MTCKHLEKPSTDEPCNSCEIDLGKFEQSKDVRVFWIMKEKWLAVAKLMELASTLMGITLVLMNDKDICSFCEHFDKKATQESCSVCVSFDGFSMRDDVNFFGVLGTNGTFTG